MAELGALLEYKSEKEYLSGEFRDILTRMCQDKGKYFESDSMEDFREGNLIITDRAQFPTWTEESDDVSAYFEDIAHWMERMDEESTSEESDYAQLEQWLAVESCKINENNLYIMAPCHPAVSLIDQRNQYIRDKFNRSNDGWHVGIEWLIKQAVLQNYLYIHQNFYVYGTGQVYFSVRKDGCRKAIPWKDIGTLTPISATRLIEKTKSWITRNCNGEQENPELCIAYFGTITDEEELAEYFLKYPVSVDDKLIRPRITLTQLSRVPQGEKYTFERRDDVAGVKRIYNLSSLTDMKELFKNFQIVLFLDESYFYRQGQTSKNLMEKGAADYVQWCLKELDRELQLEKSEEEKESIKNYYYSRIYNKAGLWLNGHGKDNTSKLGFDSSLFSTIMQAFDPKCDVYLYISRGTTIGDIRLPIQSICNDERYDGKRMLVYRVTEKEEIADNDDVCDSVCKMLDDSTYIASIDLWKLTKSIGGDFTARLFTKPLEVSEQIHALKNVVLFVRVQEADKKKPKLQFCLPQQKFPNVNYDSLKGFVQAYLKICSDESDFPYVKDYLYELLMAAMVSRAKSAKGIFYAYLMQKRKLVDLDTKVAEETVESTGQDTNGAYFRARRTIYSAIQGLDYIMVRDMDNRLSTLKYEFRYKYCPDMKGDTFLLLMDKINEYCEKAGYTDSKLYLLTKDD